MKLQVNKAVFTETGTYADMTVRPYQANLTNTNINIFNEATQGGSQISPTTLAGVAGLFIKPTANSKQFVNIENGWDTARLRFLLDLTYHDSFTRTSQRRIIQGYTNYAGMSPSGALDPNMILYFNNVLTLRQVEHEGPFGNRIATAVSESNHIIRGDFPSNFSQLDDLTLTMRPQDVFTTMGALMLGDEPIDTRISFNTSPIKKSKRKNNNTAHYVSDVLNSYQSVFGDESYQYNTEDYNKLLANASGNCSDDVVANDPFFHQLMEITHSFREGGSVTYGELQQVCPEIDYKAFAVPMKRTMRTGNLFTVEWHQRGDGEHWNGSNNETMWANILVQSVPSVMMDLMLVTAGFAATNQTLDGSIDVRLMDGTVSSFADGVDITPYIQAFINRLKTEVLKGLTSNNMIDFNITCMVDVIGDTKLSISISGYPPVDFIAPSFCDALYTPIVTNDRMDVHSLAHGFESLAQSFGTTIIPNHQASPIITDLSGGSYNDSII